MQASAWAGLLCGFLAEASAAPHGYKSSRPWLPRPATPVATNITATMLMAGRSLPESWDWRNVFGLNLVTSDWNQHIPQYCGACWIHGTVSALNDRIKVMRGGRFPDVMLGRQAIMNCVPSPDGKGPPPGCDGGDSWMIHKYMHEHKVPDESCLPYQARNMGCSPENVCRNCVPAGMVGKESIDTACYPVKHWTGYGVRSYGNVSGELAMMQEIYARGPIACSAATDDAFMLHFGKNAAHNEGVYVTDVKFTEDQIDHVMEIAGWGVTPGGIKYWVVRNSWGTYWGDMGWLKLRRGENQQLIESSCDWAVPEFSEMDKQLDTHVLGDYVQGTGRFPVEKLMSYEATSAPTPASQAKSIPLVAIVLGAAAAGAFAAVAVVRLMAGKNPRQPTLLG